jgi:hypothetical protein
MTENGKAQPAPRKRAPVAKRKKKPAAWTADKKATFLAKLVSTANVSASARACRMSESAVYRLRQRSPEFRAAWAAALREGYARLELMMLERAMHGIEKPVYHAGKQVGTYREFPDRNYMTLLTAHRGAVMGETPPKETPTDPAELRERILAKLAEMNRRLQGDVGANDNDEPGSGSNEGDDDQGEG